MSVSHATHNVDQQPPGPDRTAHVTLRLFAAAREAAGTGRAEVDAATVGELVAAARGRFGPDFAAVVDCSRVWCNGEPADARTALTDGDEVAILPPVSGGDGAGRECP